MNKIFAGAVFVALVCAFTTVSATNACAHGHGGVAIGIGVGGPGWGGPCYRPYYPPPYYAYPAPYYAYPAPYYAPPAYYAAPAYYPAPGGVIVGP